MTPAPQAHPPKADKPAQDKPAGKVKLTKQELTGKCREICEEMLKVRPELTLVRGHYHCPIWGKRQHWWLKARDGSIVDPTARQFPSSGLGEYKEWDDSLPEPTGICHNCGDYVFNGDSFCSDGCAAKTISSLSQAVRESSK